MTGKTSTRTYALIAGPAPDDFSFQWTATIFRKGYKRTTVVRAYSEQRVTEMCVARGVTEFEGRAGKAPSSSTAAGAPFTAPLRGAAASAGTHPGPR